MITTDDILTRTGIKSARTLTRWHQAGVIPKPLVGTHPSGRGKIGYYPDWVLDRCLQIQELRREGHTLRSAAMTLDLERQDEIGEYLNLTVEVAGTLPNVQGRLKDGTELTANQLVVSAILSAASKSAPGDEARARLSQALKDSHVRSAVHMATAGFNPILVFDGREINITPDFMVGLRLSSDLIDLSSYVVVPLFSAIKKALGQFGEALPQRPTALPAPKVLGVQGDAVVEYDLYMGGLLGFELIHASGRTIGSVRQSDGAVTEGEPQADETNA